MRRRQPGLSVALVAALLACSAPDEAPAGTGDNSPELGLMGTIPIFWGESAGFAEALADKGQPHWARAELERSYRLAPLDSLDREGLAALDYLLLAQPRALSPAENVALDDWVRDGGRLLLFADPQMTAETRFEIGDKRRPQDVTLLTPILAHWGLTLEFEEDQAPGYGNREVEGRPVPVNLPGRLIPSGDTSCRVEAGGALARCAVGKGAATVLADAALLDPQAPRRAAATALDWLLSEAFAKSGEAAGKTPRNPRQSAEPGALPDSSAAFAENVGAPYASG